MENEEYMRIHEGLLEGNPYNVFRFLVIEGETVKFRDKIERSY